MGTWGTAIAANDTYSDIYQSFFDFYNDGLEVPEISNSLILKNKDTINDPDDCCNFWFALAKAQWDCKELDKGLFEKVRKIIDEGEDIAAWKRLDANEKDIVKRKEVLDKFLASLSTVRAKAKPRKKKPVIQPLFEKGDCLTFLFDNGKYGGAVVLEAIKNNELGLNLIATTRIYQSNKPSTKDFENASVLVKSFAAWDNQPDIVWCYAKSFYKNKIELEFIGNMPVDLCYDPQDYAKGIPFGGSSNSLKEIPMLQFEFEKANKKPSKNLTVKEFTRR